MGTAPGPAGGFLPERKMNFQPSATLSASLAVGLAATALTVYYLFLRKENRRAVAAEKSVEKKAEQIIRQEQSDAARPRKGAPRRETGRHAAAPSGNPGPRKNKAMRIQQPGK